MTARTIFTAAAVLLLGSLILTSGSPIAAEIATADLVEPTHGNAILASRNYEYYCGNYTHWNNNSGGSPLVADCEQLMKNIDRDGKWTNWEVRPPAQIAQFGTCAYDVQPQGVDVNILYWVGNGDIITTIRESIKQMAINGKIGASGLMVCRRMSPGLDGDYTTIRYGIYHT